MFGGAIKRKGKKHNIGAGRPAIKIKELVGPLFVFELCERARCLMVRGNEVVAFV